MLTLVHKKKYLETLYGLLGQSYDNLLSEIGILAEQREMYFGGNMRRLLNIAPSLVDAFDQMIRDKRVVTRRYRIFADKVKAIDASKMTDEGYKSLQLESLSLTDHSQAVREFSDDLNEELGALRLAMSQMKLLMDSFGEEEDSSVDLFDNNKDEHSEHSDGSRDYPF